MDTPAAMRIAVIGVGNDYRHDDGVGWAVVAGLTQRGSIVHSPAGSGSSVPMAIRRA